MNQPIQEANPLTHITILQVIRKLAQVRFGIPFYPTLRTPRAVQIVKALYPSGFVIADSELNISLALSNSTPMRQFDTDGTLIAAFTEAIEQSITPYSTLVLELIGLQTWEELDEQQRAELTDLTTKLSTNFHVTTYVHHFLHGWYIKAIEWYVDDQHRLLQITATAEGGFMTELSVMIHFPLNSND